MAPSATRYSNSPNWADVTPLPQDDGGPNALSSISYTDEYREAISYLRAIMAAEEHSPRVLDLTQHVISLNSAHYTVWLYRAKTLKVIGSDIREELAWLNPVSLKNIKNYQIWHHRQTLITMLYPQPIKADSSDAQVLNDLKSEIEFLNEMLAKDMKNYHVWSYRQWLVRQFNLWDSDELEETVWYLERDVRNNSAWNHRFFVVFGRQDAGEKVTEATWQREIEFAKSKIRYAPQNESSWNYLRGLLRRKKTSLAALEDFAKEFAEIDLPMEDAPNPISQSTEAKDEADEDYEDVDETQLVRSSHALDVLAEIYASQKDKHQQAKIALKMLSEKYDPIRANYWSWRASLLD